MWRLENTAGLDIAANGSAPVAQDGCDPRALLGPAFDSLASEVPGVPPEIAYGPRSRLPRSAIVATTAMPTAI